MPLPLRQQLAVALRTLRETRGVSLEQVARRVDLTRQGVHSLETARTGTQLDRLDAIADALGADLHVHLVRREARVDPAALSAQIAALPPAEAEQLALIVGAWPSLSDDARDIVLHLATRDRRTQARAAG